MWKGKFYIATEEEILEGKASDVYFSRNEDLVKDKSSDDNVVVEVTLSSNDEWVTFTGLQEVLNLLEGKPINLWAIPEGTIISPRDSNGRPIPFLVIEGKYSDIMVYETAILGMLCQSTGISTESTRVFMECYPKEFFSFGIRRMHPAISPMIDRAAYIGGAAGVSGILGAEAIGLKPVGTMPHSIAILLGEDVAWKYINDNYPKGSRTLLIDTFGDEKIKAIEAAEKFPEIDFLRLDTHSSRRGNFPAIVREVRWELNLRGYTNIKIMVSGGIKKEQIKELKDAGADSFGIGTSIASGKTQDFAMDIVQVGNYPIAKKGKFSGKKDVLMCKECKKVLITPYGSKKECHGASMESILTKSIENGNINKRDTPLESRNRCISRAMEMINYH
ncbi:nicotinate phosphoribosyltransferase [Cuniculiplasma sp. SKW4]|uniref:nicotinate phosphoribosyltransferase n=1 Tax=Cuniculiplasma sp. SKW4 TaxID=3400171 RepID=UPI003FD5AB9E